MSNTPPSNMRNSQEPGCGKIILIVVFCIAAFMMLVLIGLAVMVPRGLNNAVDRYTSTEPSIIAVERMSEEEWEVLEDRVDAFADAMDADEPAAPLILTEAEINALLLDAVGDDLEDFALRVQLEENRFIADLSIPLQSEFEMGPWSRDLNGRYLNGQAVYDLRFADGELEARLISFTVNEKQIPQWIMSIVQDEFDADDVLRDPEMQEVLEKVESFIVEDDRVILTPVRLLEASEE